MKPLMLFAALVAFLMISSPAVAPGGALALAEDAESGQGAGETWEHPDWDMHEGETETEDLQWQPEDADEEAWDEEYEESWDAVEDGDWGSEDEGYYEEEYEEVE